MDPADDLTPADWHKINDLIALLKPLSESSITAQTIGTAGGHGALHAVLTQIEHLLNYLKTSVNRQTHLPASHSRACIDLGWKKLDTCYSLSDNTLAYRLTVLLNPCFKMQWFNKHRQTKPLWRAEVYKTAKKA